MKKLLAILLSAVLVASMCCVFVSAEGEEEAAPAPDYSTKAFWITHYDEYAEAAGCIMTETDVGGAWGFHMAFAPVEGTNAFEVVAIDDGSGETGSAGGATALEVPAGGFVYAMELGNDYTDLYNSDPVNYGWVAGWPNYCNPGCNETTAMIKTWEIGDKFVFEGLDLEGKTIPTTTPDVLWYNDAEDDDGIEYVCTATVTPYVSYDETETIDEATGDASYAVAYGYTFPINYVNGTIAGEDVTLVDNADAYAACNPNWAISVQLTPVEGDVYEVVKVVVTPGSAAAAGIEWGEGDVVLVVHSASSNPNGGYANWQSKVVAIALKAGDKVLVSDTEAYVLMPGEVIETEGDDGDDEMTLEEALQAVMGEKNEDAVFDVVLSGDESYKAGDDVTIKATVKNITIENGLHMVDFILCYDYTQLKLLNEIDSDNILDCVTACPEGDWENFSNVYTEDGVTVIYVSLFTADVDTAAAMEDGDFEFTFNFKALDDAAEDIAAFVMHETVTGGYNTDEDSYEVAGNGSYVIIPVATDDDGDNGDDNTGDDDGNGKPEAGDATNMIVFAVLALVAVAGSAVVIKSRR